MIDFFVSYTSDDERWAEWIAYIIEEQGFKVVIQAWDFRPGNNFVLSMQEAASKADRTVMVLSPSYIQSQFASPEWAAAFAQDPQGFDKKLIPILVRRCKPPGLLAPLVHIDISDKYEDAARTLVLAGVSSQRAKPTKRPSYPGAAGTPAQKAYPGGKVARQTPSSVYVPRIHREPTDADRSRFMRGAFETIKRYFQQGLEALGQQNEVVEFNYQPETQSDFIAEIFVHGKAIARARVWQGGLISNDGISFAEGFYHFGSNSCNESLSAYVYNAELYLKALMGNFAFGQVAKQFNLERLTPDEAAEYLWRRFTAPLKR